MIKDEVILKIEYKNHKLLWKFKYKELNEDIMKLIAVNCLRSLNILTGKRADNPMNSYLIYKGKE